MGVNIFPLIYTAINILHFTCPLYSPTYYLLPLEILDFWACAINTVLSGVTEVLPSLPNLDSINEIRPNLKMAVSSSRRRVKEIKDDIEVFSLNSRKTRKILRRDCETGPNIQKHGVDAAGQLNRTEGRSSQGIFEITFHHNEEEESVDVSC